MAKGDVLVRMKADVSNYDANIAKARRTLDGFKQDNLTLGGILNQSTKSIVAAAAQYASFAAVIGTVASGFSEAVSRGTEMAREMEGVKMAFDRLNQPGLLDNLREATHNTVNDLELMKQAVKFDNFNLSIEQMGTFLAFAQQQAKDTGQDVNYLVDSIVTGLGRKSLPILDNLGLSATEIRERMKETGDMTKAVAEIIQERMEAAGGYVETASDRAAVATADLENAMMELGKVFAPLTKSANSFFSAVQIGAIKSLTYIGKLMNTLSGSGRATNVASGEDANIQKGLGKLKVAKAAGSDYMVRSLYNDQVESYNRRINDYDAQIKNGGKRPGADSGESRDIRWLQAQREGLVIARDQYIQQAKQIMTPIVKNTTVDTGGSDGGGGRSGSGKGDIGGPSMPKNIRWDNYADKAALAATKGVDTMPSVAAMITPESIFGPSDEWENYKDTITGGIGSIGEKMDNLKEWTKDFDPYADKMKEIATAANQQKAAFDLAAQAAGSLSTALSSMDDPAAQAAGTVISAIANIALGFATASAQAGALGPFGWIAWLAAGAAALATTISTVHSLTGYSEGGIVGGNSYSGDNIFAGNAMLNSGEVVLTRAMAGNLASQLEGNGLGNLNLSATISGEQIRLALNNNGRRTGRGEYVQTNFR